MSGGATLQPVRKRGAKKKTCPFEVDRHLGLTNGRSRMDRVRKQAAFLAASGRRYVELGGKPVIQIPSRRPFNCAYILPTDPSTLFHTRSSM